MHFYVIFENVAVTAAQDLFYVAPADDRPVELIHCFVSQSTELADVAEEQLRLKIIRGHATVGSGGGAFTPIKGRPNYPASGATCRINDTTIASTGTATDCHAETFNVRAGWQYIPVPEARPVTTHVELSIVVRLMAAPADSVTMGGVLCFRELT